MRRTILILTAILFVSYTANAQTLTGQWQVSWNETLTYASPTETSRYETYDETLKLQVREGMEGRHYAIESNGEVTITSGVRTAQGTWTMESGLLVITMGSSTRSYVVTFIDNDTLTLELADAPATVLFSKPVLKRIL